MAFNSAADAFIALNHAFFDERDAEKILSCVTDDIKWIGTEEYEYISGKDSLRRKISESLKRLPKKLKSEFSNPEEAVIDENAVMLTFNGYYKCSPEIPYNFDIRGSMCCVRSSGGWLIKMLHLSVPNMGRENYNLRKNLSQNEERRHLLSDSIPGGTAIYRLKKDGRVETEYISENLAKLCGYSSSSELMERIHFNARAEIPDEDWDNLINYVIDSINSGEQISTQYHVYNKEHKIVAMNINANVIIDETVADDELAVMYAVHTLPTMQEIREQRHYRTIIDMLGIAYWEWTKESGFYCTKNYQKYLISQAPLEDVKNNRVIDGVVHSEDIDKLMEFFSRGDNHHDRANVTLRLKMTDGCYQWTEILGFKEYSETGEAIRLSCVMRNVNDEYGRNLMMSRMFNAMPGGIGIFVFGQKTECDFYNDGLTNILGISREEMDRKIADNSILSSIIAPFDFDSASKTIAERTAAGLPLNMAYRFIHSDGSIRWLHISAEKIGDRNGLPTYYCVFTTPTEETALYRSITEDSANGIAVFEYENRENIYINSAAIKFYGLSDISEATGKSIVKVLEDHDLPLLLTDEDVRTLNSEGYSTFHVKRGNRFLAVKGKRIDWGSIDAYILYIYDETTEHIKELELENLLNRIPTGIATYHIDRINAEQTFVNNGFCKTFRITKQEYATYFGSSFFKTIYPDDVPKAHEVLNRLRDGKNECDFIYRSVIPEHRDIWVRMTGIVAERSNDEFTLYAGYTDVTEQIEAQKRQQELFDTIPSGILEFFYDGTYLSVISANQTLIDMVGYSAEEFNSSPKWDISKIVHPDDRHLLSEAQNSVTIGKGMTYDFRLRSKKTGLYRWISCDFTITERSAAGIRAISAFLDIDDKRRLEDASTAKSQFLSRMSHEIRTPINAIMGIAELEKQDVESGSVSIASIRKYSQETFAASKYLLTLVNDILDTSRIENNRIELHCNPINVEQYLNDIRTLVAPIVKEKNINFIFERRTKLHETYISDGVRIKQILLNLLNNAFKFTPSGGTVSLVCEAISETEQTTTVQFTISDTGIGMSKEFQEKMFTPFAQENSDTTSPFTGTGLGLSIARSLARKMNGDIICHSESGKGATFIVTIVVGNTPDSRDRLSASNKLTENAQNITFEGVRILICEDHPLNQMITKALLERKKCTVELANDGVNGVEMFGKSPVGYYSMILMDIRMPNMDGLQATEEIRRLDRPDAKTVPIVAMSANAFEEDIQKSLAAGMNMHLAKPIDAPKLYSVIAHYAKKVEETD